ncbi:MAG: C40 family peptidase [Lachnospiraceae bacterium]|nr:C40 family peptidase [Lachnospiraceae bacterium]
MGLLLLNPMEAHAEGTVKNILMETAGAGATLQSTLTYEDYKGYFWGYTNLGIANVDNNLNIRKEPGTSGKLVGKLPKNAACEILDEEDGWVHIISGEVEGYVSGEYLLTGMEAVVKARELVQKKAKVTCDSLKVREEASTEAEVIMTVAKGEKLDVLEEDGEWVKVDLDGQEVYVFGEYVEVSEDLDTALTITEVLYGEGVSDVRVELCEYAKQFVGNPYVWGGTSLTKGADCSGFVLSVFAKFGVTLPHYSVSQSQEGTKVAIEDVLPGDLIFYSNGKQINHVAIYIGNGQVIHASSPKTGIKISKYNYRTPVKARRILVD